MNCASLQQIKENYDRKQTSSFTLHMNKKSQLIRYILLPVGGQHSLGFVVAGQPVDPALDENQAELGIFVLQTTNYGVIKYI